MAVLARDIMSTDVISVPTTMDLRDLGKLFLKKGITGAPVVDEEGQLAGVISQTDLVYYNLTRGDELVFDSHFYHSARVEGSHVPAGFQFEDFNSGCVADVMTPVVHSVTEIASVESVARLMTRKHIHRVIVRRGQVVSGVISALDVLRATRTTAASAKKKTTRKTAAGRGRVRR
jgi:CBS domain-containing protein